MVDIGLSELKLIIQAVREKYGYDFSNYAISSFKRRMLRIMELKKLTAPALLDKIKTGAIAKEEFLGEVTVNVTEMFRDPSFWKVLRVMLATSFLTKEKIRIWHAGCSSGEEVYSMLILLKEINLLHKTEILASDIDTSILEKAKRASISAKNMELNKSNYQRFGGLSNFDNYFTKDNLNFSFDKTLLSNVTFKEIDLVKAMPTNHFDLVLCRNVLIYFNQNLQNDVLKVIHQSLFTGGHLVIGVKESIAWCEVAQKFTATNIEERIYKKIKE